MSPRKIDATGKLAIVEAGLAEGSIHGKGMVYRPLSDPQPTSSLIASWV
jgi:hypothetical protein